MAIDETPASIFAPWPDRLRHSAIILLAAGLALTVLVALGQLPLLPAAAVFLLIAAAALVPWRLHDVAASRDDVRTEDPVEAAAVNAIVAGMPDPAVLLDRAGRVIHLNAAASQLAPALRKNELAQFALRSPEIITALREAFPRVIFSDQLFAIDRDRYTCTGGIAPLDLMLHIIKQHQGRDIAPLISEQFILDRIRNDQDRQHIPLQARVGLFHENLIEAAALMEANIEEPLSLDEIASLVGVSRRQIERLFKRYVGQVPTKYYLDMRLRRARDLLLQTSMSIMQVAVACGFQSPPHFSKCYRMLYGYTPSAERGASRAQVLAGLAGPLPDRGA